MYENRKFYSSLILLMEKVLNYTYFKIYRSCNSFDYVSCFKDSANPFKAENVKTILIMSP
jgi:hypothetical protein